MESKLLLEINRCLQWEISGPGFSTALWLQMHTEHPWPIIAQHIQHESIIYAWLSSLYTYFYLCIVFSFFVPDIFDEYGLVNTPLLAKVVALP